SVMSYLYLHDALPISFFLPFNRGNQGGKGNPIIYKNYRSSYHWNEVLQKDSLLDLLFRFVYIEQKDIRDSRGEINDQRETIIFRSEEHTSELQSRFDL